jgi:hypothetical protein
VKGDSRVTRGYTAAFHETGKRTWYIQVGSYDTYISASDLKLHSSVAFRGSYFAVSQFCGVAPRIKIYHSDPSTNRSIRIVRHLEQAFGPYPMMFMELKEIKKHFPLHCVCKEKKNTKTYKHFFFGGGSQLFAYFHFSWRILKPNPHEKRGMSVFSCLKSSLHLVRGV